MITDVTAILTWRKSAMVFLIAILITGAGLSGDYAIDDDETLEFYWSAASGTVHHYNVYLSIDGKDLYLVGTIDVLPTKENPYQVPIVAQPVHSYRLQVEAEDEDGLIGPMSEPSLPVWRFTQNRE